jgi:hypothetical protein
MEKLLPTITCFIITSLCLSQTNIYDDFDSYKAGEFLGTESNGLWTTWTNSAGTPEDTYVTDQFSFSPDNCIQLVSGGVTDVILSLGNENSGSWTLSYMMNVEEGYGAYFNLLHYFSAAASNWAVQVYFNASGDGSLVVGSGASLDPGTAFVYPTGSWFEVRINIDVDGDVAEMYFDDTSIYSWTWSEGSTGFSGAIASLNLYPNPEDEITGETDSYFVDNVSFHEYGLGLAESEQVFNIYPNPAKNSFSINTEHNSIIEIYNVLGESISRFTAKNYETVIDCLNWEKGLYFIKTINGGGKDKISKLIIE